MPRQCCQQGLGELVSGTGAVAACAGCVAVVLSQPVEIRASGWFLAAGIAVTAVGTMLDCCNSMWISWGMRTAAAAGLGHDWRSESWLAVLGTTAAAPAAAVVALPVALLAGGAAPSLAGAAGCLLFGVVAGAGPAVWSRVVMTRIVVAAVAVISTATPAVSVAYLAALGLLGGVQGWLLAVGVAAVVVGASAALHQPAAPTAVETGIEPAVS